MKKVILILLVLLVLLVVFLACESKKDTDYGAAYVLAQSGLTGDAHNGTVLDVNGKTWTKCTIGQSYNNTQDDCSGTGGGTTYGATSLSFCTTPNGCTDSLLNAKEGPAFDACNNLSLAGITGWRLPTYAEQVALIAGQSRSSFLLFFPQTPDDKPFWARNEASAGDADAYTVSYASSSMAQVNEANKQTGKAYVRCMKE